MVIFILTIPLNNSLEVMAMMRGELPWGGWSLSLTPLPIKLIKDFFLIFAIFLMTIRAFKSRSTVRAILKSKSFLLLNFFSLIFIGVSVFSIYHMPLEYVAFGFRGYWSIFLVYAGALFYYIEERSICKAIYYIFAAQLIVQIAQFILGSGYAVYGELRSPGFFMIPATAGAFALLVFYFAETFGNRPFKILAFLSLILSSSTMGLLVLLAYFSYKLFHKLRRYYEFFPLIFVFVGALATLFIANLGLFSGRGDSVYESFSIRTGYIFSVLGDFLDLTWGRGMGIATSQAVISGFDGAVVADNTYTGAMLNLGWIAAIILLLFSLSSFFLFRGKLLFFIFAGYSMTTVIFEINPIIQILMILLGMHMMKKIMKPDASSLAAESFDGRSSGT